jgi:hypothetical protein
MQKSIISSFVLINGYTYKFIKNHTNPDKYNLHYD